ncbi:uncharacterized protein TRUGW13939_08554 [Talaromyces rugulosus]|uniref:DUF7730 domain-containing protein n=1 Tax=Talaromyces rugulosus TaxID=121627 RepID=A0A7H8R5F6_TALRU|nr:uncharacterized protein TRUGW13939_08554 [Talaromyces rugulosus]QKX61406.1 hypothetical protein TRUGW13939_08554 [Talaromyces rugulosus]
MKSIKKWTKKIIHPKVTVDEPEEAPPPLPFLNTPAIPPLTEACQQYHRNNYGLFGRLPLEIRQEILVFAFGQRTLHVDLRYGPLYPPQAQTDNTLRPDHVQQSTWRWFSCECHRWTKLSDAFVAHQNVRPPFDDHCVPTPLYSRGYTGPPVPAGCSIGVMGWLLACRMAYQDGIEILFTTNKFHFSGLELQQNLSRLLPLQRLARISSLVLIWDLKKPRQKYYSEKNNLVGILWERAVTASPEPLSGADSTLHELCRIVLETFPNLHHLYISLQSHIAPPEPKIFEDPVGEVERVILSPIDEMVRALGPGRDVNIAIQLGGWQSIWRRRLKQNPGEVIAKFDEQSGNRIWKGLGDATAQPELGYWLCAGWDDIYRMGSVFSGDVDVWGEEISENYVSTHG